MLRSEPLGFDIAGGTGFGVAHGTADEVVLAGSNATCSGGYRPAPINATYPIGRGACGT